MSSRRGATVFDIRQAVRIAVAIAFTVQVAFVASVHILTGGDGFVSCGSGLYRPAPPEFVYGIVQVALLPIQQLPEWFFSYTHEEVIYRHVLRWAADLVHPGISPWLNVAFTAAVNLQVWALGILALLWTAAQISSRLGFARRAHPLYRDDW